MIVATHRKFVPPADSVYLPVQAGASLHAPLGYLPDNDGVNISEKNGFYCELTALYWAWKNHRSENLGLVHYRRYFCEPWAFKKAASEETLLRVLQKTPVVLPQKRRYWIETGESQYVHAHGSEGLEMLCAVMAEQAPEYLPAFRKSLKRRSGHRFNMFVMRRDVADAYCSWLFDLLFAQTMTFSDLTVGFPCFFPSEYFFY